MVRVSLVEAAAHFGDDDDDHRTFSPYLNIDRRSDRRKAAIQWANGTRASI